MISIEAELGVLRDYASMAAQGDRLNKLKSKINFKDDLNRYQEWVVSLIQQNRSSEIIGYKDWLNRLK